MAHHLLCHANDIMPNSFPPAQPTLRDHGYVSEYEQNRYTQRNLPQSLREAFTESDDEDALPIAAPPRPTQNIFIPQSTSALDLTPDKRSKGHSSVETDTRTYCPSKYQAQEEGKKTDSGKTKSLKVTFDPVVDVRHTSPNPSIRESDVSIVEVEALGESFTDGPDHKTYGYQIKGDDDTPGTDYDKNERLGYSRNDLQLGTFDSSAGSTGNKTKNESDITSLVQKLQENLHVSNKSLLGTLCEPVLPVVNCNIITADSMRDRHTEQESESRLPEMDVPAMSKVEHVLARPEFNSMLRVTKEIENLSNSELNIKQAVEEKLKKSEELRTKITGKANSTLNVRGREFSDLISVDTDTAEIAERRKKQVKKQKPPPAVKSTIVGPPPDLLDFYTPDLQRETLSLEVDGLPNMQFSPTVAPQEQAFAVYRHIRANKQW